MAQAILNGKLIKLEEAVVSITDKGYFFDFAVYSSIKVVRGKIFFPEYHVARLFESARLLDLDHKFKEAEVLAWLEKLVAAEKLTDALLRITLIGDPDGKGDVKLFIFSVGGLTFYPDKFYRRGIKVITYKGERRIANSKNKDLLLGFLAYREAKKQDALDALLIDHEGNIREGTRTNFFAIKGETLITPPRTKVLEGITKKVIIQAVKDNFKVIHADIPFARLKDYEEFFISSTSMNVMPIRQIDDLLIETDFKKTKQIGKLFKDYYSQNLWN